MLSEQSVKLHQTLSKRWRPEDVAELILETPELILSADQRLALEKAASHSLKSLGYAYSSMPNTFMHVSGAQRQFIKVGELFQLDNLASYNSENISDIQQVAKLAKESIAILEESPLDFLKDRLNKEQRDKQGLGLSKRQYNKRFRLLQRLDQKQSKVAYETRKRSLILLGKSRLASEITRNDFLKNAHSAVFIAYYTARLNLRSEFTVDGQKGAYDDIAVTLFKACLSNSNTTNWWAIAQVYPDVKVLSYLSEVQKVALLSVWFSRLKAIATILCDIWNKSSFKKETMIVQRGDDSTTWNQMASAWNKARDSWIKLLYNLGMQDVLEQMCPGKVLRLMAADVAFWHARTGGSLDADTQVWNDLPLPWKVLSGELACTKQYIINICKGYEVDPIKSGWIAPKPQQYIEKFSPTPELVHGVTVENPHLAKILRSAGFFSGKN